MARETVTLWPKHLECIRTAEITEEPYLCLYQNWVRRETLGHYHMKSGDTRDLSGVRALTGEQVGIVLSEADSSDSYDDHLGGIQVLGEWIGPHFATADEMGIGGMSTVEERGMHRISPVRHPPPRELDLNRVEYIPHKSGFHYVTLPYHEGHYTHSERRYRLYFYLKAHEEEVYIDPPYCLDLLSLECENAQQWKDYPYIKVNGLKVWGPRRMRDVGDASFASIEIAPITIYDVNSIMLWEQDDSGRDDLFGEFEVRIGRNFNFGEELTVTYAPDATITGDARYVLTYRVRQRRRDIDGNYLDCPEDT